MKSVMRLEDFAAPPRPAPPRFSAADLAAEYLRGRADAAAEARQAALAELTGTLRDLAAASDHQADIRRQAVAETVAALGPVIQALARQLSTAPAGRLIRTLSDELERLCLAGIAPTCRIAAGPELIAQIGDHIAAMGLKGVTILPGIRTEITFDGGRIAVDPDDFNARIAGILAELSAHEE